MRRMLYSFLAVAGLIGAASPAHATANHKIEAVQKIVKDGKVLGARVHLLVDAETYKKFRINVAPQATVPPQAKQQLGKKFGDADFVSADMVHRQTLAGARRGFVLKTLAEKNAPGLTEMYVDIPYGGPLRAGMKVNVLSTFTNGAKGFVAESRDHMHVFGAWDGPMNQNDSAYIVELPGAGSDVPKATKTLAQ